MRKVARRWDSTRYQASAAAQTRSVKTANAILARVSMLIFMGALRESGIKVTPAAQALFPRLAVSSPAAGAETKHRRTRLLRADIGRLALEIVVEVGKAHAAVDAGIGPTRDAVGLGELAVRDVVVEVVPRAAGLVDRGPAAAPDLEDVVARDGVGERLLRVAADARARAKRVRTAARRLHRGVVADVAPAVAVLVARACLEERTAVVGVRRALRAHAAMVVDVAEDVERSPMRDGAGDAGAGLVEVVAPDAHVAIAALGFDRVVPDVRHDIAVDIAVGVGEAGVGEVVLAADAVVVVVPIRARDLVVADDVVAAAVADGDALRARGMAIVPAVRAVARIVDPVPLDDQPLDLPWRATAVGPHAGIHVDADLPAGTAVPQPPPAAYVVVLDDHVVRAFVDADRVLLRAFQREAAHDDVRRGDHDVELLRVLAVDGGGPGVQHIAVARAAFGDVERFSAFDLYRLGNRKFLVPRIGGQRLAGNFDLLFRFPSEVHEAAAAFAVARIEPERKALLPRAFARLAVAHRAARGAGIRRRRVIEADRLEGGDRFLRCGGQRAYEEKNREVGAHL